MNYLFDYTSPIGLLRLTGDNQGVTGLHFATAEEEEIPKPASCPYPLVEAMRWLDCYFSHQVPNFVPTLHMEGTPFQRVVWDLLLQLPYGTTCSYKELAGQVAARMGKPRMSAQAIGGAVGRNPVAIIVPCHRVIGADGTLTGYAGGLHRKQALLRWEAQDETLFSF